MKIVICGAGAVGTHLAELLSREDQDIILIDENPEKTARLTQTGEYDLMTLNVSPTSISGLKEAGVPKADLVIAVTPEETRNITCCMLAHALGAEILDGMKRSWARQYWEVHDGALVMLGVKLRETADIVNIKLKDLCNQDTPYHVVAVKRGDDTIIPGGNDMLLDGDIAYFMTTKKHIQLIRKIVGKENYADVKDVMIMGGGRTTVHVAEGMPDFYTLKIIEQNEERCMQLNEILDDSDIRIIQGDGRDTALLIDEGLKDVQAFAALTPETETNILACLTAKRMGVRKTVALVENMDYVSMAEKLDIGTIINKKMIAAGHIHQMMLRSDAANVKCLTIANADVAELLANEESPITKAEVKDLRLPVGVTLGGLVRNGVGQPIYGNTRIQAGDYVVLFCKGGLIKKMDHYFAKPTSVISRIKSSFSN